MLITSVVEVPSPLVVVGEFWKYGLGDKLLGLIIEVEVEVIPQQEVEENCLAVGVVTQRRRSQPRVQEADGSTRQIIAPADRRVKCGERRGRGRTCGCRRAG